MTVVLIVDDDALGLAIDLNGIASQSGHDVEFTPLLTPEELFDELQRRTPDLILLHHHWPGITISTLLERIASTYEETRVIVFTNRALDLGELIECVRFGVADYWADQRSMDPVVIFRQISHYCSNAAWTLGSLRRPSGSLSQLLRETEVTTKKLAEARAAKHEAEARYQEIQSREALEIKSSVFKVASYFFYIAVTTIAVSILTAVTTFSNREVLLLVGLLALFYLFLEGRVAAMLINWKKGFAQLKGK